MMAYANSARDDNEKNLPLAPSSWRRMQDLYDDGATDLEIAAEVGCSSKTVQRWRRQNEFPRNDRLMYSALWPDIENLYMLGLTDTEIASRLGIDIRFVGKWRRINDKERN